MKVLDDSSCFGGDGQCWPPGFRFHPTDEELVLYYLKRKICRRRLKLDIIGETDVYKWDPDELPGQSMLKTGDRQWFFFSPRDRKYPNGARSNRATRHGYWKATGKDRIIMYNSRAVGLKKTLVFYEGRAPTGVRTNWVMHEYTLDEEELKRCQGAQDYYALYKAFKKSGPGPKNGEQYGAPFREEDWPDDENTNVNDCVGQENPLKQANDIASVGNTRSNGPVQFPPDDLEEFMNRIANESVLVQLQPINFDYSLLEEARDEETQSTLADQSLNETYLHENSPVLHPSGQQNDVQAGLNMTQSASTQLQHCETSEVTSAPDNLRQESRDSVENFLEDFLEMDDLVDPEPISQNVETPFENLQVQEVDGLSVLDLYHDAAMFLRDMDPTNSAQVSHSYFNNFGNEMVSAVSSSCVNNLENELVNPVSHLYSNNLESEVVHPRSHSYYNNFQNETANQLDYQTQLNSNDQISSQLWEHDQRCSIVTPGEPIQGAVPLPTSGVVCDGSSANLPAGVNLNQSGREDGRESWFSSALWTFVESIPTTPASASEGGTALVNKAFERMSSFGRMGNRMRINIGDPSVAAGNSTATLRRSSSRYSRWFFFFAVIGVLCAILWVSMGSCVKILGRFISS